MTVAELIVILQTMPPDLEVEVNNNGREIFAITEIMVSQFGYHYGLEVH